MSFGMNYEEDFRAVQMHQQAYRDEVRQEWLLRAVRNSHPRKSLASTLWCHFLEWIKVTGSAKPKDVLHHPSARTQRTSS